VFGRDAGHDRGDDHVTRAIGAIDHGPGIDGDGQCEQRIEREPAPWAGTSARMSPFVIVHRLAGRDSPGLSARAIDIPGHCVHYGAPSVGQMT